ncbi:MAG: RsmB/NOP family class I SAM-dependent RNA methyltransferase [Defluviitaleaceae bacterium]|nr:RsmB/NOP family class I SAM-dependent RNA methyltransferase [Defluviitaleaceae bacterium]
MQLPETFLSRTREQMRAAHIAGEDFSAFLTAYDEEPWRGVRVNQLKITDENAYLFVIGDDHPYTPIPWCKEGFAYREPLPLGQSLAYLQGLFYIQEPSAMSPASLLDAKPGERILDLCAAPGGKTTQIAGTMQGEGLFVANDASPTRAQALVRNIERAGVRNAIVLMEQPRKLAERFPAFFDRVLVDAPCSGEGMFRRDPDVLKAYTANKPEACAAIQSDILRYAAAMVKPGGRLVYSTCTFNTIENEEVIDKFLSSHNNFSLIKTKRLWPHKDIGEGHFMAVLQKTRDTADGGYIRRRNLCEANGDAGKHYPLPVANLEIFSDFCRAYLTKEALSGHPVMHNHNLYLQPEPLTLNGLRVARSGWHVGEISKERFIPSQALAMGLHITDARYAVDLTEANAWRYVRGESLDYNKNDLPDKKPWVFVCHDTHPLGWARFVQGRLKNHLPVGWVRP